jgi:hypothetical protein
MKLSDVTDTGTPAPKTLKLSDVAAQTPAPMSWGQAGISAAENIPSSAARTAESVVAPIVHPVATAEGLYHTGAGELEKLGLKSPAGNQKYADALNSYFTSRYGSVEGFKQAIATDPVGVVTDISMLVTGGGEAAARLPGIAGKVGEAVAEVGSKANPITQATKAAGAVVKPAAKVASGIIGTAGTHTGGKSLEVAAQAGAEGGNAAQVFLDNLRGDVPVRDVVDSAKSAVAQMRQDRSAAYRGGMAGVVTDPTVLNFNNIDKAVADANQIKQFKGQELDPHTAKVRQDITKIINDWKALEPAEYHTVEGMDALKQRLRSLTDSLPFNTPERVVADQVYKAVRQTIVDQAPQYAKVMKDYEKASDLIQDIEKTFHTSPKASVDTQLRALQSIMRNNVYTNFGQRLALGDVLTKKAPNLEHALAGQALSSWTPRGLGGYEMGGDIIAGFANPKFWAALPFMLPRLMGETAYYGGKAYGGAAKAAPYVPGTLQGLYAADRLNPYDPLSGQ